MTAKEAQAQIEEAIYARSNSRGLFGLGKDAFKK